MSGKTIALMASGDGGAVTDEFLRRLHDALVAVGCRVETAAASDSERILELLESGAVPVVGRLAGD
jgi:hypothetical protein